jgi:putative MFS transporter
MRLWLPESPRSLLARGRQQQAARLLAELERRHGVRLDLSSHQGSSAASSVHELLRRPFLRRTLCMSALWFTLISSYNGFIYWLPGMLADSGFTLAETYNLIVAISLCQVPAVLAAAFLTDRFGRKWTLVPALLLCAVSCVLLGLAQAAWEIVLLGAVFSATNLAGWAVMFAYTPEVFPTRLRGRGVGVSSAWGRVASLLMPLLIGALLAAPFGSRFTVFLVLSAVLVFGGLAVAILGEETHGRPLEAISS